MNLLAKSLLASTALSPLLLIVGVNQIERYKSLTFWIGVTSAVILAVVCKGLLMYASKHLQKHLIHIKEFESKDQEMLTFLLIYLLPFIRSGSSVFASEWKVTILILVTIVGAIAHAGALHFNPVMGLVFGYHFYAIKNSHGVSTLLISRTDLIQPDKEVQTVQLASNVYLQTEDVNV